MAFKPITVNTAASEPAHILAEDDAALYAGIIGGDCVLPVGSLLKATVQSNNKVRVSDGAVVVGGHVGRIIKGDYEDLTIANGASGVKRNDIIAARFIAGSDGGADSYSLVVIKGTAAATATDPVVVKGDLYAGDKQRDYPLWRVKIEGLSIVKVEQMYEVGTTNKDLSNMLSDLNGKFEWTSYPQSSISIATFYTVRDFDLRKRDNEVFLNVSLSISTSTQWDPNTLYTILSSPLPAELRPPNGMSYYLNGFGCDNNWGATTPMTAFVANDGRIKYSAPSKSSNFKICGHWFVG